MTNAREMVSAGETQLGGTRPMTRYSVTVGRFTVTDTIKLAGAFHGHVGRWQGKPPPRWSIC